MLRVPPQTRPGRRRPRLQADPDQQQEPPHFKGDLAPHLQQGDLFPQLREGQPATTPEQNTRSKTIRNPDLNTSLPLPTSQTAKRKTHTQQESSHKTTQVIQTPRALPAQTTQKRTSFTHREGVTRAVQATAPMTIQITPIRAKVQTKARTAPAARNKQTEARQNKPTRTKLPIEVRITPTQPTLLQPPTMS